MSIDISRSDGGGNCRGGDCDGGARDGEGRWDSRGNRGGGGDSLAPVEVSASSEITTAKRLGRRKAPTAPPPTELAEDSESRAIAMSRCLGKGSKGTGVRYGVAFRKFTTSVPFL